MVITTLFAFWLRLSQLTFSTSFSITSFKFCSIPDNSICAPFSLISKSYTATSVTANPTGISSVKVTSLFIAANSVFISIIQVIVSLLSLYIPNLPFVISVDTFNLLIVKVFSTGLSKTISSISEPLLIAPSISNPIKAEINLFSILCPLYVL